MNFLNIIPENQHLIDEHKASAAALERAVEDSKRHKELYGEPSQELTEIVLSANRRHMDAHQAVLNEAAAQAKDRRADS